MTHTQIEVRALDLERGSRHLFIEYILKFPGRSLGIEQGTFGNWYEETCIEVVNVNLEKIET